MSNLSQEHEIKWLRKWLFQEIAMIAPGLLVLLVNNPELSVVCVGLATCFMSYAAEILTTKYSKFWATIRAGLVGVGSMAVASAVNKAVSIPAWPQFAAERTEYFKAAGGALLFFTLFLILVTLPDSESK